MGLPEFESPVVGERRRELRKRRLLASAAAMGLLLIVVGAAWALVTAAGAQQSETRAITAVEIDGAIVAARRYLDEAEPGRARLILESVAERAPDDPDVRALYGEALLASGEGEAAYAEYAAAVRAARRRVGESPAVIAELEFAAGTVANTVGRAEDAVQHYMRAQLADPSNPKHPLYLAQVQRRLGMHDEAKASLVRAAKLDPSQAIAWGVLADISLSENSLSLARQHVRRAREIEPGSNRWRLLEAKILRRDNDPAAAARLLTALPEAQILADQDILRETALTLGMLGRPGEAASLYMRASNARPRDAGLSYEAALWLERAGRPREAAVFAQAAADAGYEAAADLLRRVSETPEPQGPRGE